MREAAELGLGAPRNGIWPQAIQLTITISAIAASQPSNTRPDGAPGSAEPQRGVREVAELGLGAPGNGIWPQAIQLTITISAIAASHASNTRRDGGPGSAEPQLGVFEGAELGLGVPGNGIRPQAIQLTITISAITASHARNTRRDGNPGSAEP